MLNIITTLLNQMTQFYKMRAKNYKPLQKISRSRKVLLCLTTPLRAS